MQNAAMSINSTVQMRFMHYLVCNSCLFAWFD